MGGEAREEDRDRRASGLSRGFVRRSGASSCRADAQKEPRSKDSRPRANQDNQSKLDDALDEAFGKTDSKGGALGKTTAGRK